MPNQNIILKFVRKLRKVANLLAKPSFAKVQSVATSFAQSVSLSPPLSVLLYLWAIANDARLDCLQAHLINSEFEGQQQQQKTEIPEIVVTPSFNPERCARIVG